MGRKTMGFVLAAVMIVALWPALGLTQVSIGGFMGSAYRLLKNVGTPADENVDNWMQRVDLNLTAKTDAVTGFVMLRMDSVPHPWGTAMEGRNALGRWGAEQVTVEVKQAYVDFKIPGLKTPSFARVGVQYHAIRPFVFLNAPGAGISFRTTCDTAAGKYTLAAGWGKMREKDEVVTRTKVVGTTEYKVREERGADILYGSLDFKGKQFGLGAYVALAAASAEELVGNLAQFPEVVGTTKKGNIWWIGFYSDGKIGPVNYQADVIFDTGNERTFAGTKYEYSGWLARAVLTYPYQKATFGLGGIYVSGDDATKSQKVKGFVLPAGTETLGPAADSLIVVSGWGAGPGGHADVGLMSVPWSQTLVGGKLLACEGWGGVWGLRLFADYKALDWLKLAGQVAYWGDTYKNGDTFERGLEPRWKDKDEKSIGVEVDLAAQITLYKNLNLYTVFGYLFNGKAYDEMRIKDELKGIDTVKKIDNPYAFVINLVYTF